MEHEQKPRDRLAFSAMGTIPLHVAVVLAGERRCHVTADTSATRLTASLAGYVRQWSEYQRRPEDAKQLSRLLADGRPVEAVELYFATIGQRWNVERLVVTRVDLPLSGDLHEALPT